LSSSSNPLPRAVRVLLLLLAAWIAPLAFAVDSEPAFEDPLLQARYEQLNKELRCVQCLNQAIADSNAPIARDLRNMVKELIEQGRSDEEVRAEMRARYGEFVLYRPRFTAKTALLWLAPALLLLAAGWGLVRFVRARSTQPYDDGPDPELPR
jgi:cytochrome c-type biogenesis protein CcmH